VPGDCGALAGVVAVRQDHGDTVIPPALCREGPTGFTSSCHLPMVNRAGTRAGEDRMTETIDSLLKELTIANATDERRGNSKKSRKIRIEVRALGHWGGLNGKK